MTAFDTAQRRFENALSRIEAAIGRPHLTLGGVEGGEELVQEVVALRDECARLGEALEQARREQAALKDIADKVAERLNGTIAELDALLEA